MFVVNSRLGFSSAAGPGSARKGPHRSRPSFSRSYGCILPSSLTRVFPRTLGFSPRLPVSVLVRAHAVSLEAFLDSVVRLDSACPEGQACLSALGLSHGGFASHAAYRLRRALPAARPSSLLCHSILKRRHAVQESSPAVHRLCFLPRLRSRLALGRRALPRSPSAFGGRDSHAPFRYSYRHSRCDAVQPSFRSAFVLHRTLPYPCAHGACRDFGSVLEPRISSAQGLSTSELLRTL